MKYQVFSNPFLFISIFFICFCVFFAPKARAFTVTPLLYENAASGFFSTTTAPISPGAYQLVLAVIKLNNPGDTAPTLSGNSLTWVKVGGTTYTGQGGSTRGIYLFRAMSSSPTSGAVTITDLNSFVASYSIFEISNVDTSGTNGSGAIVQAASSTSLVGATSLTINLASLSSASNMTVGVFGYGPASNVMSPGGSFTQIDNPASNPVLLTEYANPGVAAVNMTAVSNANYSIGGVAIEVKAGSSPTLNTSKFRLFSGMFRSFGGMLRIR